MFGYIVWLCNRACCDQVSHPSHTLYEASEATRSEYPAFRQSRPPHTRVTQLDAASRHTAVGREGQTIKPHRNGNHHRYQARMILPWCSPDRSLLVCVGRDTIHARDTSSPRSHTRKSQRAQNGRMHMCAQPMPLTQIISSSKHSTCKLIPHWPHTCVLPLCHQSAPYTR